MKITHFFMAAALVGSSAIQGCASDNRMVYGSGFSFANYDYMVIAKPGEPHSTTLYGLDVDFANLMTKYGFKVIGDHDASNLSPEQKLKTLQARLSLTATDDHIVVTESFDELISDRTVASVTGGGKGDIISANKRGKAFENTNNILIKAIVQDKGLTVSAPQ